MAARGLQNDQMGWESSQSTGYQVLRITSAKYPSSRSIRKVDNGQKKWGGGRKNNLASTKLPIVYHITPFRLFFNKYWCYQMHYYFVQHHITRHTQTDVHINKHTDRPDLSYKVWE